MAQAVDKRTIESRHWHAQYGESSRPFNRLTYIVFRGKGKLDVVVRTTRRGRGRILIRQVWPVNLKTHGSA